MSRHSLAEFVIHTASIISGYKLVQADPGPLLERRISVLGAMGLIALAVFLGFACLKIYRNVKQLRDGLTGLWTSSVTAQNSTIAAIEHLRVELRSLRQDCAGRDQKAHGAKAPTVSPRTRRRKRSSRN